MVRRVWIKDRDLPASISAISGASTGFAASPPAIFADDWDTLNTLQKTEITDLCTANNYIFDHDE